MPVTSLDPPAGTSALPMIEGNYLMVCPIPYYRDQDGCLWIDPLWHRDFVRHFMYLRHITLASPFHGAPPPGADLMKVDVPPEARLDLVALPRMRSTRQALYSLLRTTRMLWKAVGDAAVVHSGVIGWPYPLGWLANPMAVFRRKKLILLVESAPWRLTGSLEDTWTRRLLAGLAERMARWSLNHAGLAVFTQEAYRQSMLTDAHGASAIIPASWIDEEEVLSPTEADNVWRLKRGNGGPVRILFAGRLTADKGVLILGDALSQLPPSTPPLTVDIIGDGPLRDTCSQMAGRRGQVEVRLLQPVKPGAPFLKLLSSYHAMVAPSVSHEQPRIVFDAASQAVPVIASDTDGLRPHVTSDQTGWLVPIGDAAALAAALGRAAGDPAALERMGKASLGRALAMTHAEMHRLRWRALVDHLGAA
jgi:glycosyltransferase involved in cell wall biosynthesis